MNRMEYEAGRAFFRLLCRLQREAPIRVLAQGRLQSLQRHPLVRRYVALMRRTDSRADPLSVPIARRLYWFRIGPDDIPF